MEEERSINRQQFLRQAGICFCGCAAILSPATLLSQDVKPTQDLESPVDKKMQFAHKWVKRFFDILDQELDAPTCQRILEENGKQCYQQGLSQKYPPVSMEKFIEILQKGVGKKNCRMERNTVYFNFAGESNDLQREDGYCLCPLVEDGPSDLSGTYCHCSIGYVREMFTSGTNQKVEVELLESVKRGGKSCRFKITLV